MTPVMAATVHIVSSGQGESYESALKAIQQSIKASTPQLSTKTTSLSLFSLSEVASDDLIITLGDEAMHTLSRLSNTPPIIYSFADLSTLPDGSGNWAATVTAQPLSTMLTVITPLVSKLYKNELLVAYSNTNKRIATEVTLAEQLNNGLIAPVTIDEGEKPAKYIEDKLFKAGALIAVNDKHVWQGENARWMLYQAYRYKVPVVGYSKKFLKAGALVSVYSTLDQIALKTAQLVQQWEQSGQLVQKGIIYADYNIEFNRNIARALNMDVPADTFNLEPLK
jgi:ABC-type uncharacterized transport system substrate-binding protein